MIYLLCIEAETLSPNYVGSLTLGKIYKVPHTEFNEKIHAYYRGWRVTRFQRLSNVEYLVSKQQAEELPKWSNSN